MKISVKVDTSAAKKMLANLPKQVAYAEARALTACAKSAVTDLQTSMRSVFAAPTPYTLNAFYPKPATRSDPTAYVTSREGSGKGRPASKYLASEIFGGPRRMKGMELLLGAQSGQQFMVPGTGVTMTRARSPSSSAAPMPCVIRPPTSQSAPANASASGGRRAPRAAIAASSSSRTKAGSQTASRSGSTAWSARAR